MSEMTLREVCNLLGVPRRAVQGYEEVGLVSPSGKNKYGYLLYNEHTIDRIRIIKLYQDFGFAVKEIKVLLEAPDDVYVRMLEDRLEIMRTELKNLEVNIEKIKRLIFDK